MSTANPDRTTDGWRGRPSSRWSEGDILNTVMAFATGARGAIAIGYDGRAGSRELAALAAHSMTGLGLPHVVSSTVVPTPALGRFVASRPDIAGGVIMTASHNPPGDVGVKLRGADGLPFTSGLPPWQFPAGAFPPGARPLHVDEQIIEYYRTVILRPLQQVAEAFAGDVVVDAMYGAVGGLAGPGSSLSWRRAVVAPFFFGVTPDPVIREQAVPEMAAALADRADPASTVVFMTDGDGDRLCAYTAGVGYISSTELAGALIESGIGVGRVISTHVADSVLETMARSRGIAYESSRVGFKNIVARWTVSGRGPAMGVEPNGGVAVARDDDSYFERDGLAVANLVLRRFGSVRQLNDAIGEVRANRRFPAYQSTTVRDVAEVCEKTAEVWPGCTRTDVDGIAQLRWPNGWRVLVRRSGTEPVTRCYIEADDDLGEWMAGAL